MLPCVSSLCPVTETTVPFCSVRSPDKRDCSGSAGFDIREPVLRNGREEKRRVTVDNLGDHVAGAKALSICGTELPAHAGRRCDNAREAQDLDSLLLGGKTRLRFVGLGVAIVLSRLEISIAI
jgi:hypothetical protein